MKAYSLFLIDPRLMGTYRQNELNPAEYRNYHSYLGHDKEQYDRVYVFTENKYVENNRRMFDSNAHYYHLLIESMREKVDDGTVSNVNALKYLFFDIKRNKFYVGRITNLLTAEPEVEDLELKYGYWLDTHSFIDRPCLVYKDKVIDILDYIEVADTAKWFGHDFMQLTDEYKIDTYATKKYKPLWAIRRFFDKLRLCKQLLQYVDSTVNMHKKWPFGEVARVTDESEAHMIETALKEWELEKQYANENEQDKTDDAR